MTKWASPPLPALALGESVLYCDDVNRVTHPLALGAEPAWADFPPWFCEVTLAFGRRRVQASALWILRGGQMESWLGRALKPKCEDGRLKLEDGLQTPSSILHPPSSASPLH